AGRRLFTDAANGRREARPADLVLLDRPANQIEDHAPLFRLGVPLERGNLTDLLELGALVHHERRVAAVVDDQRGARAVRPLERLARAPPVLVERLAFPS